MKNKLILYCNLLSSVTVLGRKQGFFVLLREKKTKLEKWRGITCPAWLWGPQSTQRVAIATFWRTFHQDGKTAQPSEGGGARPPPFTISTITYKVVVYSPAERADTLREK